MHACWHSCRHSWKAEGLTWMPCTSPHCSGAHSPTWSTQHEPPICEKSNILKHNRFPGLSSHTWRSSRCHDEWSPSRQPLQPMLFYAWKENLEYPSLSASKLVSKWHSTPAICMRQDASEAFEQPPDKQHYLKGSWVLTMAMKYTLLEGTRSLSLSQGFFEFQRRRPQSMTMSQYVLAMVAMPELAAAMIFQIIPPCSSLAVLKTTAAIVEKYFSPLSTWLGSFSSTQRRKHYIPVHRKPPLITSLSCVLW